MKKIRLTLDVNTKNPKIAAAVKAVACMIIANSDLKYWDETPGHAVSNLLDEAGVKPSMTLIANALKSVR